MKKIFAIFLLCSYYPLHAHQIIVDKSDEEYESQKGYAYENKCFRYEYKEYYVPGNSISPGYVKSYNEKVSVPCNSNSSALNNYDKNNSHNSYVNYNSMPKCTVSTTLGGLIGGGIAASLSKRDAYGWSIPLGAVLGAGIGNSECN
tara:strand:+ start:12 stop:449 length:438 start_codon:yes stop_codon:yes gene_type:complete